MDPRIAQLASAFDEQDAGLVARNPLGFAGYDDQIARARAASGAREACVWGWADIGGAHCALVVMDFGFLGGSMGVAVGEKVARAFDAARDRRLPVVTVTASGGARMQEGMVALVQMAKTAEARRQHAESGLPHVTVLTSPTTGGVYASFASLADVVIASPDATVGFAGPRVVSELTGATPDPRTHKSEFARDHGLVDAIIEPAGQPAAIARVLNAFHRAASKPSTAPRASGAAATGRRAPSAWDRLQLARHPQRPRARALLAPLLSDAFELRGDRTGAPDDDAIIVQIGALETSGRGVVVIAQDGTGGRRIRPQGYRKAIRAIAAAGRTGLPVVTLIDTRGADPLPSSEGGGVAVAIANTIVALLDCRSPTLCVVTGEGGSGGALALAVCDRVLAWENAVFSVIAPEGAASILRRDASRGPELAEQLRITAADLVELGIADAVIAEPAGGAHTAPAAAADDLAMRIAAEIESTAATGERKRLRDRHRRWRERGNVWIEHIPP
jgi:acetyl-CoA carboxylase carboxyl transferase subunit beta